MRLHIFGASGSGVTTLGETLSAKLDIPYIDSDQYFWLGSMPIRPLLKEGMLMKETHRLSPNYINTQAGFLEGL